jgi:hypothetical protein
MSQQINPVAVRDVVLDLDDKINFAVYRSGQNITSQKYPANSQSNSQHVYSIQVPSTSTIVSRNLCWNSTITLVVTGTVGIGEYLVNLSQFNYSATSGTDTYNSFGGDCLAPFPLNQLCTNMNVTINNTSLSMPINTVLDPILRAVDCKKFQKWNSTTPTQLDKYGGYQQALCQQVVGTTIPTLALPANALMQYIVPAFNSPFNNFEDSNCNNNEVSRNSFKLISVTGNTIGGTAPGALNKTVTIKFKVREPIFVSPFLFGEDHEAPGLAGVTQIQISAQMDTTAKRALRWVCGPNVTNKAVASVSYQDSSIEVMYYTPKPSDMIPATVVTPLTTYTLYSLPSATNGLVAAGAACPQLVSNSIMLNSYPDKVFVFVENQHKYNPVPTGSSLNEFANGLPDAYASINKVVITLNNQSGILSTFTLEDLYRASLKSGSQQSFAEFTGLQTSYGGANEPSNVPTSNIPTCGSVLMLNFADIINISQDFYAPGSLSTAQFQITVDSTNNLPYAIQPALNLIMMYSGILSTANGASSAYVSGVLTKENVLNAAAVPRPINSEKLARYVGSGLKSSLKSIATSVMPFVKKEVLAPAVEHLGSMAVDRLSRKLRS